MREVIEHSVAATRQLFIDKQVALTAEMPAEPVMIRIDRDRFVQVTINLLSNAVKFVARAQGKVNVSLRADAGGLMVAVRDNGPGVSAEDQAMIFERFRQVGDTMTDKPAGTGLGLPISRQIVEHFGGKLWVDSELGKGACFSFNVPRQPDQ
jgi:signal transduction histidine kinase